MNIPVLHMRKQERLIGSCSKPHRELSNKANSHRGSLVPAAVLLNSSNNNHITESFFSCLSCLPNSNYTGLVF